MSETSSYFVTVDGPGTRDIDDAFSLARTRDGLQLCVAIAMPAARVLANSEEDLKARTLAASTYARSTVTQSMLPKSISEDTCSLIEGLERPAMLIRIDFDGAHQVKTTDISFGSITVRHRLTYEDVPRLSGRTGELGNMMQDAIAFSKWLLTARRSAGALAFFDLSNLLYLDEEGGMRKAPSADDMVGHIVIQEFMVLANTQLAKWAIEHEIPFLYRTHRAKLAAPPISTLMEDVQTLSRSGQNTDAMKEQLNILMSTAEYSAHAIGHYALNLPYYAHGTSPLRRYADLVNQRQMMARLNGAPFPHSQTDLVTIAAQINEKIANTKLARSESFKEVVVQRAARALDGGQLSRMGDPELVQAIKMSTTAGGMPEALSKHLASRMLAGNLPDKVLDSLVVASTKVELPADLLTAWTTLLGNEPTRAKHFLMFVLQSELASNHSVDEEAIDGGFRMEVRVKRKCDGAHLTAAGVSTRKKDAENLASSKIMCMFVGATPFAEEPELKPLKAVNQKVVIDQRRNYKGELLEWCQKHKAQAPVFDVSGSGPSNAMIFSCRLTLNVRGDQKIATVNGAKTKKEAESAAAESLLSQLL